MLNVRYKGYEIRNDMEIVVHHIHQIELSYPYLYLILKPA